MEFNEVVRRRRMVRRFDPDRPVPAEVVDRMLDNAVRAPSAGFTQGWAFLVLEEPDDVARYWAATSPEGAEAESRWLRGMRTAPLLVIPLASKQAYLDRYAEPDKGWTDRDEDRWPAPYWDIDTAMASLLILLTAVDEGLGACFFGIPPTRHEAFDQAFDVPPTHHAIGAIAAGYPAPGGSPGSPATRSRRPLDEVVHRGRWRSQL